MNFTSKMRSNICKQDFNFRFVSTDADSSLTSKYTIEATSGS